MNKKVQLTDCQSTTASLKKMEADGYIKLAQGIDHRSKQISLTAGGIRLCEKTVDRIIEVERNALEGLSSEEQELFLSLFHKYTDLLKQYMQDISLDKKEKK